MSCIPLVFQIHQPAHFSWKPDIAHRSPVKEQERWTTNPHFLFFFCFHMEQTVSMLDESWPHGWKINFMLTFPLYWTIYSCILKLCQWCFFLMPGNFAALLDVLYIKVQITLYLYNLNHMDVKLMPCQPFCFTEGYTAAYLNCVSDASSLCQVILLLYYMCYIYISSNNVMSL